MKDSPPSYTSSYVNRTVTSTIMAVFLLIFAAILSMQAVAAAKTSPLTMFPTISDGNGQETCPSTEQRNTDLQKIRDNVYTLGLPVLPQCGEGIWYRIAYLNMTDSSQQCPSAWREYNTQFRACGRPVSSVASHPSQIFPISRLYSKVCGRVIGIQVASPDAFHPLRDINGGYMDGVSITRGSPRHHIWSYAAAFSEVTTNHNACQCDYSANSVLCWQQLLL